MQTRALLVLLISGWLALLATKSDARMMLSTEGTGQVLHYPFYTVNDDLVNLINVTNHSSEPKAVRVRFLEGRNGRITLQFNLFLAARDVWTAAVTASEPLATLSPAEKSALPATIKTVDTSCTAPQIPARGVEFLAHHFVERNETGAFIDNSLARTRQGYIEVIEMGVITNPELVKAVTHVNNVPFNCALLQRIYVAGPLSGVDPEYENALSKPTGKLSGTVSLINVFRGVDYSYDAVAIDDVFRTAQNFATGGAVAGDDRASKPSLADANRQVTISEAGKTYFAEFADGLDAVSALYQRSSVSNEWITDPTIASGTDFVATLPTRRLYDAENETLTSRPPFSEPFGAKGIDLPPGQRTSSISEIPVIFG